MQTLIKPPKLLEGRRRAALLQERLDRQRRRHRGGRRTCSSCSSSRSTATASTRTASRRPSSSRSSSSSAARPATRPAQQGLFKSIDVPARPAQARRRDRRRRRCTGKVAVDQIVPGQQLTRGDFKAAGNGIVTKLAADQRAITVSLDNSHGMLGNVRTGDHVDVLSGFELEPRRWRHAPGPADAHAGRARPRRSRRAHERRRSAAAPTRPRRSRSASPRRPAPKIAFAADNGKLWLVLRPQNGEKLDRTLAHHHRPSLLVDAKPVNVRRGRTR